jgi:hypothetical protein
MMVMIIVAVTMVMVQRVGVTFTGSERHCLCSDDDGGEVVESLSELQGGDEDDEDDGGGVS